MVAFDLVTKRGGVAPDVSAAKRVTTKALEHGLVLLSSGVSGETTGVLYPLTISESGSIKRRIFLKPRSTFDLIG